MHASTDLRGRAITFSPSTDARWCTFCGGAETDVKLIYGPASSTTGTQVFIRVRCVDLAALILLEDGFELVDTTRDILRRDGLGH